MNQLLCGFGGIVGVVVVRLRLRPSHRILHVKGQCPEIGRDEEKT